MTWFLVSVIGVVLTALQISAEDVISIQVVCGQSSGKDSLHRAFKSLRSNNNNPPTFSNLTSARDYIRTLQPLTASVQVLVVDQGSGCFDSLELDGALDSGNYPHTITYESAFSASPATITGGLELSASGWYTPTYVANLPSAAAGNVVAYNLSEADFGSEGYGHFFNGGLGACQQTQVELFFDGTPMTIARYPNVQVGGGPWMNWLYVDQVNVGEGVRVPNLPECTAEQIKVPTARRHPQRCEIRSAGVTTKTNGFTVKDTSGSDGLNSKLQATVAAGDVWVHGFWAFDWADNYVKLDSLTPYSGHTDTWLLKSDPNTPPVYEVKKGARFYILNSIAELDSPGEYYLDKTSGVLYFWPPTNITADSVAVVTVKNQPLISQKTGTDGTALRDIVFRDLKLRYARGNAVSLQNASRVVFEGVSVDRVGRDGISISGKDIVITGLQSEWVGCTAVSLSGGDTMTLVPANITIRGSDISTYARWTRTYNPGVHFGGVGVNVIENKIHDAPHNGLLGGGNNHLFFKNELRGLCYEVTDSGAFYVGRSWVDRGMVLHSNRFHDIVATEPTKLGSPFVHAMYFDDEQSGMQAINNYCHNVDSCFIVGGGRDNLLSGNRAEIVKSPMIQFDNRGMNWQHQMCNNSSGELVQQLYSVNYTFPPYSVEYPAIVNTMSDHPCVPVGNSFIGNTYCNCTLDPNAVGASKFIDVPISTINSWFSYISDNTEDDRC